jgi:hypothetical protein
VNAKQILGVHATSVLKHLEEFDPGSIKSFNKSSLDNLAMPLFRLPKKDWD